jgi:hypothetical protein
MDHAGKIALRPLGVASHFGPTLNEAARYGSLTFASADFGGSCPSRGSEIDPC